MSAARARRAPDTRMLYSAMLLTPPVGALTNVLPGCRD